MSEIVDLHVLVRGRVQGVGFRYSVLRYATSVGIQGWVRNRTDGAVEVAARGTRKEIDAFAVFLGDGPRSARVESVEQLPPEEVAGPGFEVRY